MTMSAHGPINQVFAVPRLSEKRHDTEISRLAPLKPDPCGYPLRGKAARLGYAARVEADKKMAWVASSARCVRPAVSEASVIRFRPSLFER